MMRFWRDLSRQWRRALRAESPPLSRRRAAAAAAAAAAKRRARRRTIFLRILFFPLLALSLALLTRSGRQAAVHDVEFISNMARNSSLTHQYDAVQAQWPSRQSPAPAPRPLPAHAHAHALPHHAMRPPQFGEHAGGGTHHLQGHANAHVDAGGQRHFSGNFYAHINPRRTCYASKAGDGVCVHRPMCLSRGGLVYLSEMAECIAGTRAGACVSRERLLEAGAEVEGVSYRTSKWLAKRDKAGGVQWYSGATVVLRVGMRDASTAGFAKRALMLHHVIRHSRRYGVEGFSNVLVVPDERLARKIRFSKSWQHAILSAVVYPHRMLFSAAAAASVVSSRPVKGSLRVFVAPGPTRVGRRRKLACFGTAALPAGLHEGLFLARDRFPDVGERLSRLEDRHLRTSDAARFRELMYAHAGRVAPKASRRVVYLHRAHTRALTTEGSARLELALKNTAESGGFSYTRLDIEGAPVRRVLGEVGDAGVVVGVHGNQMLATLFLGPGSGIVEIFPYRFRHDLYRRHDEEVFYGAHSVIEGKDFSELGDFTDAAQCQRRSAHCRDWYRSDKRPLLLDVEDAHRITKLVKQAMNHLLEHQVLRRPVK